MSAEQHAELAERGAVQLAASMATEFWPEAREAAYRMFELVEPERRDTLIGQLDQDNCVLSATAEPSRERVGERIALRWEGRLAEMLARHLAMQNALQEQVRAAAARQGGSRGVQYRQSVVAKDHGTAFGVQGGNGDYYGSGEKQQEA